LLDYVCMCIHGITCKYTCCIDYVVIDDTFG
jgi:hypothetical protein